MTDTNNVWLQFKDRRSNDVTLAVHMEGDMSRGAGRAAAQVFFFMLQVFPGLALPEGVEELIDQHLPGAQDDADQSKEPEGHDTEDAPEDPEDLP